MLDMGPYYITALVNLIGPVARVAGITSRARSEREITSEPLKGTMIPVNWTSNNRPMSRPVLFADLIFISRRPA